MCTIIHPGFHAVFLSAELATATPEANHLAHDKLGTLLAQRGFDYHVVLGSYQGKPERSYRVRLPGEHPEWAARQVVELQDISKGFDQESILFVNSLGSAVLVYNESGEVVPIGQWVRIDGDDGLDKYTDYSLVGGEFFTVIGDSDV